jgi:cytochrome c oxidase subunit 1
VSVIDPDDAVTGFRAVLLRDGAGVGPRPDLAYWAPRGSAPVAGVILAPEQPEYGTARCRARVHAALVAGPSELGAALVALDTRLDTSRWPSASTTEELGALLERMDVVASTRLGRATHVVELVRVPERVACRGRTRARRLRPPAASGHGIVQRARPGAMSSPRTTLVIATRDRRDELLATLAELTRCCPGVPRVAVGNASSDGTPAAVWAAYPSTRVIELPCNYGAVARNVGVVAARKLYIAFADDDSWRADGALAAAELAFETHPNLGLIAARTLVGMDCHPDPIIAELADSPLRPTAELPWPRVLGFLCCSATVRREAFLQAGGFSPILHFVGEERLLAWDRAAAGWACCYLEHLVAYHHPSAQRSSQHRRRRREVRNRLLATWLRRRPARRGTRPPCEPSGRPCWVPAGWPGAAASSPAAWNAACGAWRARGGTRARAGAWDEPSRHVWYPELRVARSCQWQDGSRSVSLTRVAPQPVRPPVAPRTKGRFLWRAIWTTDPKDIGVMYTVTAFTFFLMAGVMAMLMRTELARPGLQLFTTEQYNQLFTMHGTLMLLLFATPIIFGFANCILPLQIGSPDVAFPRLNAFSFWLFAAGGFIVICGFFVPGGAADFGWFAYQPLAGPLHSPGLGGNLWAAGLVVSGLGTILGAVNMLTTVICLRAPGMTLFRMPIFTWNVFITSILILVAFPILTAGLMGQLADRNLAAHIFDPANGGAILWQHMFWFFGHPEVYIVAVPFFGIVTDIIPVFSRKPVFGYKGMVFATMAIIGLSFTVWAHHMFVTGSVLLPFFAATSFLIAVPTGIKFFNWIGTMWKGQITLETPMLFALGFIATFLFGGLTGVLLAAPSLDFHVSDTYFVVAHFHYVLFGTIVFAVFAGVYFWFPKMTGRMMDDRLGKLHFWTTFIGFHLTFLIQHWLGNEGMPRRYADYLPSDGFTTLNTVSTIGAYVLGASMLPFIYNVFKSYRFGEIVDVDDPWGYGQALEWATTCPPPRHNFYSIPRIRSERPAFDLHYPHIAERGRREKYVSLTGKTVAEHEARGAPSEQLTGIATAGGGETTADGSPS